MRYFGERILLSHMHWVNLQMKLLWAFIWCCFPFPRNWEKIRIFSVFLVYWKTENTSFYFYFSAYFSKLSFVWLVTTGDSTVLMSQKTDSSPKPQTILSQHWACPWWADAVLALFEKSLVLQWGKSHEHSDKYKQTNKQKKCFLETNTWLCPLQKQLEETGKPCVQVLLLVTPLWHGQLLDVTGSGGAMWELVTILSQCLAVALIFLIN